MKNLVRTLVFTFAFLILLAPLAVAQEQVTSITQLKEQILLLEKIDNDSSTPQDVRTMNQVFLEERRSILQSLLQKRIDALQKYRATVQGALTANELLVINNSIQDLEHDLKSLVAGKKYPSTENTVGRPLLASLNKPESRNKAAVLPSVTDRLDTSVSADTAGVKRAPRLNATETSLSTPASAVSAPAPQNAQQNFNDWLNERTKSIVKARLSQRSNTSQIETPSIAENTTTFVDQSSSSDLIGVGLNLAGLSTAASSKQEANSVSVTASAYSLYAALNNIDPLNPAFYNSNRGWRKLWFTLGYDDVKNKDGSGIERQSKIFGVKWLIKNFRDPSRSEFSGDLDNLTKNLAAASGKFGKYFQRLLGIIFRNEKARKIIIQDFRAFLVRRQSTETDAVRLADINSLITKIDNKNTADLFIYDDDGLTAASTREERMFSADFQNVNFASVTAFNAKFGPEVLQAFEQFLEKDIDDKNAFVALGESTRDLIAKIRRAPQISISFLSKQRPEGFDDYIGQLIFDWGIYNRVNLTLNGNYQYMDTKITGGDVRTGRIAGQFQFQLNDEPASLVGRKPFYFYLGGDANFQSGTAATYRLQGKFSFSIYDGIDFPVSVTFANRRSLINEKKVKGNFGFTIDTARLMKAITSGLPIFQK